MSTAVDKINVKSVSENFSNSDNSATKAKIMLWQNKVEIISKSVLF